MSLTYGINSFRRTSDTRFADRTDSSILNRLYFVQAVARLIVTIYVRPGKTGLCQFMGPLFN